MVKIVFDAGHSMVTPGKRFLKSLDPKETREWFVNQRIVRYIEKYLSEYDDVEILRVDDITGQTDVPLTQRTSLANAWGGDLLISNHHNAGVRGGLGGGIVIYRYPNSTMFTKEMQKGLYDKLIAFTGLKGNRYNPLGEANFHMVRESDMPAILIENGFMDSSTDVPIILTEEFAKQSAMAQTEFIVELFGLTKKPVHVPEKVLYRVQTGAFRFKENAENWMTQLLAKGYEALVREDGGIYRVQTGAFSNRLNAESLSLKLRDDGFANFITTKQGNIVSVGVVEKPVIEISPAEQLKLDIKEASELVGDKAKELQEKLIKVGYSLPKYGADGVFGEETYIALLKFQADNNITVDGFAGEVTFAKLNELLAPKYNEPTKKELQMALNASTGSRLVIDGIIGRMTLEALSSSRSLIRVGTRNELVKYVQRKLGYLGFFDGKVDGIVGDITAKAIREFQLNKNIASDGIIGINTWKELIK